jgi:hypothetical protein
MNSNERGKRSSLSSLRYYNVCIVLFIMLAAGLSEAIRRRMVKKIVNRSVCRLIYSAIPEYTWTDWGRCQNATVKTVSVPVEI